MNKVYEDDVGILHIEMNSGHPVIHCDIKKWSKDTVNHCFEVWSELLLQLREKGFSYLFAPIDPNDRKLQKFASLFGMEKTNIESLCVDEKTRDIWRIACHKLHH